MASQTGNAQPAKAQPRVVVAGRIESGRVVSYAGKISKGSQKS